MRLLLSLFALFCVAGTPELFTQKKELPSSAAQTAEETYDRLDGRGASGKRVDVIEWEGNLEVHVYPKGSLAGLALKLDRAKSKTVMVIAYRFTNDPKKQLIRRAIIGIPFADQFKAYQSLKEPDFDKIVVSNNGLADLVEYKLDPEPKQLYPEEPAKPTESPKAPLAVTPSTQREPSADEKDSGTIRPFQW